MVQIKGKETAAGTVPERKKKKGEYQEGGGLAH